jgi:predicted Ser/Thr protein kinase
VEVLEELGRGGFGVVYRAREPTGREVAVKVLLETTPSPERRERFLREGQIAASLKHPGLVPIHLCWVHAGRLCLAYELVRGCRTFRESLGDLDRADRLRLLAEAGEALGHAHARGVVHRDVKGDNILIDAEGRARVADFGIASAQDLEPMTKTGQALGTPYAMAPEQFSSAKSVTPAADVWSLGVLLYEALTGTPPFEGENLVALAIKIDAASPAAPRSVDPTVPAAVEEVCLRTLRREPADRYPDGSAFAAALRQALAGEAPAGSGPPAALKWAALALAASLAGGLILWTGQDPPPTPERSPPVSAEEVEAALRQGRCAEALALADSLPGPEAARLRAEALLGLGRHSEALAALGDAEDPTSLRLRARALLAEGTPGPALEALSGDPRPEEAARLHGVLQLLRGDLARGDRLLGPGNRELVLTARSSRALRDSLGEDLLALPSQGAEGLTAACEDLTRLARRLPPDDPLSQAVRHDAQDAVSQACLNLAHALPNRSPLKRRVEDLCAAARALAPDSPQAEAVIATQALIRYHQVDENDLAGVLELLGPLPEEPTRARPELRAFVLAVRFLGASHPSLPQETLAERALNLPFFGDFYGMRLRRAVLYRQSQVWAWKAYEAASDRPRATQRALTFARRSVDLGGEFGRSLADGVRVDPAERELRQLAVCALLAGDLELALATANRLDRNPEARAVLLAERALVTGDAAEARRLLAPFEARPTFLETVTLGLHLQALGGEEAAARRRLGEVEPRASEARALGVPWRTPAGLRAVLDGGWWPGRR